ncbi:EscU/YscU/HrcU family type III secretion system export apparatus switch protein [Marivita sp. GX14005]|uniref:EscU/YscU/HrcU family type III secretion system export apparatus switch protein n=1 Tax=Marivita sp. GX14005 TaxID=2942276 RepID=UPI0020191664|nr:EscU/YscU/HrcU family type III secretion system export apparatus switch protein [Marivita sp. GX14005]MCL3881693.1 EscU/YscU/HrcU family type III secretion system export apparatus switch protein [Marivita sp. GX14005]
MSGESEDQGDKPYEASRRKLEEARKKGEIVRSQDAVNLGGLVLFILAVHVLFGGVMTDIVGDIAAFLRRAIQDPAGQDAPRLSAAVAGWILPMVIVLFLVPFSVILTGLIAARQVIFTADKLKPKLNRISPLANAKKKYGPSGLFEFLKNFIKFLVFAGIMTVFARDSYRLFESAILRGAHAALANVFDMAVRWLWCAFAAYCAFAVIDLFWQAKEHAKKNRMSHKELKDEHKNEEGDENVRQQRRARAEEIATNRMLVDVPKATVVITNPTHFAVALQWSGAPGTVPKCVARGTDETARKIREIAMQSGVPLYRDPPTAREIYANVKIGMTIEQDHYKAVAAAIAYARRIQNGMRK